MERPKAPAFGLFPDLRLAQRVAMDGLRSLQTGTLDLLGFGAQECPYEVIASGPHWRLRHYPGPQTGASVLLVPAPIKRSFIWDLAPGVSAVRFCLERQFGVHLMEWLPPEEGDGHAGIDDYAGALVAAGNAIAARHSGLPPFVLGHSLGGTLAAIACALQPALARGLVLLGAPISFEPGSSHFRDLVVAQDGDIPEDDTVAGSLLSQSCALLAPETFVWPRLMDAAFSLADPAALNTHIRVVRWGLEEVPLPGRLVHQIVEWLYREDRFRRGTLTVAGRTLGPDDLRIPMLAVVNPADEIGPRAAVEPFFARVATGNTRIIEHPAEIGIGLQHLAILAGRRAHAETWPAIADWMAANA